MSFDWRDIGKTIYGILGVSGYRPIQMWNEEGSKTMDPEEAIRFIATKKSNDPALTSFDVMIILHDENSNSHLDLETPNLTDKSDFDITYDLKKNIQKNIGDRYGLTINWEKFSHSIKNKDEEDVTAIQESKDIGKVYGTTKSSFQRVGESKLIVRHTDPIDESKQGSRWRKIKGIFIETKDGERFKYPHPHISGARAMARHLAKGGSFNDRVAESILHMSEDYLELKHAGRLMKHVDGEKASQVRGAWRKLDKDSKRMSRIKGYDVGLKEMADAVAEINEAEIEALRNELAEQCGCDRSDDSSMNALSTAARYISKDTPTVTEDDIGEITDEAAYSDLYDSDLERLKELANIHSKDVDNQ